MCPRDGVSKTSVRAATMRQKLQKNLAVSPSQSILTPDQGRLVAKWLRRLPRERIPGSISACADIFSGVESY